MFLNQYKFKEKVFNSINWKKYSFCWKYWKKFIAPDIRVLIIHQNKTILYYSRSSFNAWIKGHTSADQMGPSIILLFYLIVFLYYSCKEQYASERNVASSALVLSYAIGGNPIPSSLLSDTALLYVWDIQRMLCRYWWASPGFLRPDEPGLRSVSWGWTEACQFFPVAQIKDK